MNKKPFNISFSSISCFNTCQRNFYYSYIKHFDAESSMLAYADAGNCVHTALEQYNSPEAVLLTILEKLWKEKKLDTTNRGMFNRLLKKDQYMASILTAKSRQYDIDKFEERLEFNYRGYIIKAYIDAILKDSTIVDWKTSSKMSDGYLDQLKFYSMMFYQIYKKLPKKGIVDCIKINETFENVSTMDDIRREKQKIDEFIDEVESKKTFDDWSYNKDACFFCVHKNRCKEAEVNKDKEIFEIEISGNKFKINNLTTPIFDKVINKIFSYDVANKDIVILNYKKKYGRDWDGRIKLCKHGWYGLGLLSKMKKSIKQYAAAMKKVVDIQIIDRRNKSKSYFDFQTKLNNVELRKYQIDAVNAALDKKIGIIKIATSGGKTIIASEIFRRMPVKTIFLVDRNILVDQTIEEFEKVLNLKDKIGRLSGGIIADNKSNFFVGTIQTISTALKAYKRADKKYKANRGDEKLKSKRLDAKIKTEQMQEFLSDVDCVITDECHIAGSESYNVFFSNLQNCHYSFGLSGTPGETDENFMEVEKNVGPVIFDISAKQLIDAKTIMKPEINFIKYDFGETMEGDFNDYQEQLFDNKARNNIIASLCNEYRNSVILILTSRIAHGETLAALLKKRGLESFFIRGSVDAATRQQVLKDASEGHPRVLIGTSSIVAKGLNLPLLKVIINATGNISDKMTVQSLGRVLRKHDGKDVALYYDFFDDIDYFHEHSMTRIKAFEDEGHDVTLIDKFINILN